MNTLFSSVLTAALGLVLISGCSTHPEAPAVFAALDKTVEALDTADWAGLWAVSAPVAREELLSLHTGAHAASAAIDRWYPEVDRLAAHAAIGGDVLVGIPAGGDDAGPQLLARLFTAEAVRLDEKARDGLHASAPILDGDTAIVHTAAGEEFTFRRTPDGWRSRLVMDILTQNIRAQKMAENIKSVMAGANRHRIRWRESRAPTQPQGAWNVLRDAMAEEPVNATLVMALLDAPSRAIVADALKACREVEKTIQRQTPRKKRAERYAALGLTDHIAANSDIALLTAWLKRPSAVAWRGFGPPEQPDDIQADAGSATLRLKGGATMTLTRSEGQWRISGLADALRTGLQAPVDAAKAGLTTQGSAPVAPVK